LTTTENPSGTGRWIVGGIVLLIFLAVAYPLLLAVIAIISPPPQFVGQGQIVSCPPTPNCVSSLTSNTDQYISPIRFDGDAAAAQVALERTLREFPRVVIVQSADGYIHAEARTRFMRFIDDLEFVISNDGIDVRSASRLGTVDFGLNRSRMEQIRDAFDENLTLLSS
jgi:uncharacterized protein (DUF1499 family)